MENDSKKKPLLFMHITKNGGTSISNACRDVGLNLGKYNHIYRGKCRYIIQWYHRPPRFQFRDELSYLMSHDWFCVVRNPYERMISTYMWDFGWSRDHDKYGTLQYSPQNMNDFLQYHITNLLSLRREAYGKDDPEMGEVGTGCGHFTPQWLFLAPSFLRDKMTVHVLQMENLDQEFNALMNKYGFQITLKHDNLSNSQHKPLKKFDLNDLTSDTIALINAYYEKDFELFGYSMIKVDNHLTVEQMISQKNYERESIWKEQPMLAKILLNQNPSLHRGKGVRIHKWSRQWEEIKDDEPIHTTWKPFFQKNLRHERLLRKELKSLR